MKSILLFGLACFTLLVACRSHPSETHRHECACAHIENCGDEETRPSLQHPWMAEDAPHHAPQARMEDRGSRCPRVRDAAHPPCGGRTGIERDTRVGMERGPGMRPGASLDSRRPGGDLDRPRAGREYGHDLRRAPDQHLDAERTLARVPARGPRTPREQLARLRAEFEGLRIAVSTGAVNHDEALRRLDELEARLGALVGHERDDAAPPRRAPRREQRPAPRDRAPDERGGSR